MNIAIKVIRNTAKRFVSELEKESRKASRKAINKCGLLLRNKARQNLKASGIHITDNRMYKGEKRYNDKMLQGIRAGKTYRKDSSFKRNVRITANRRNSNSGWYRLGWLNKGTKERFNKKFRHSTGSMKATHFYDNALSSFNFTQTYNDIMAKEMAKIKK